MDTIRRRIQTDGFVTGSPTTLRYTGVATTARIILAREGWRGFFKGVSVNWMRVRGVAMLSLYVVVVTDVRWVFWQSPLATGISLTAYDLLKDVLGVEKVA